ncbi:MAG: hypothetical protein GY898_04260 [Proteobacteria bacterium]|nr:hypothetical protein [Pseudomonadota bacterium]
MSGRGAIFGFFVIGLIPAVLAITEGEPEILRWWLPLLFATTVGLLLGHSWERKRSVCYDGDGHLRSGIQDGVAWTVELPASGVGVRVDLGAVPRDLVIRAEFEVQADVDLGVRVFDDAVELRGAPAYLSAVMDEPTRRLVLRCVRRARLSVESGVLRMRLPMKGSAALTSVELKQLVDDAVAIATALRLPASGVREALAAQVQGRGPRAARDLARERLLERYPREPESITLAREQLADARGRARLLAACVAANEDGAAVLSAMAATSADGVALQCEALWRMGGPTSETVLLELLRGLTDLPDVIDALGRIGGPRSVEALRKHVIFKPLAQAAIAAIQARHEGRGGGLALSVDASEQGGLALASEAPDGALSKERS